MPFVAQSLAQATRALTRIARNWFTSLCDRLSQLSGQARFAAVSLSRLVLKTTVMAT